MRTIYHFFHVCWWFLALLGLPFSTMARAESLPVHNAVFITAIMPTAVLTGQVFSVSMTVSNTGQTAWREAQPLLLAPWELCFLFDHANQGWIAGHGLSPVKWTDKWGGVIYADQTNDNAYITKDIRNCHFGGAANDRVYVRVYSQFGEAAEHDLKLYWTTTKEGFYTEAKSTPMAHCLGNERWEELWFEAGNNPTWRTNGPLASLRLDFDRTNHSNRWIVDQILVLRGGSRAPDNQSKSSSVSPGTTAKFTVQTKAPTVPGVYPFVWRMGEKGVGWFGESHEQIIQVVASSNELAAARSVFSYGLTSWHTDDGLPHNVVQALAQTSDGYLWIGTQKGLARFDGAHFTVFGPKDSPAFPRASITALCAGRDGSLWIGTDGGGVTRRHEGVFSHFDATNGLAGNVLRCIYETGDGALWFGTTAGLSRLHHGTWTTWTQQEGLSDNVVRSLCEAENGDLWVGTGLRLNRLAAGKVTATYDANNGLEAVSIRGIWRDQHGELWIASNTGLFCKADDQFFGFSKADGLEDQTCTAARRDRRDTLWVGNFGRLNRLADGRFVTELSATGEGYDVVNAMLEDREGNVWLGGKDGLHRLRPTAFTTYTRRHGLSHNNMMSVCEDAAGTIWAGTWGGGVNQFKDGKFTALTTKQSLIKDQAIDQVLALCPLRDGSIWIGFDYERGLARWEPEHGFVESFDRAGKRPFAQMRVIFQDRQDVLWLGTRDGLYRKQNQEFRRYGKEEGLPHNGVRAIFEDREGGLWIGTQQGVALRRADRFEPMGNGTALARFPVVSFYEDETQALWLGTAGAGLHRFKDGKFSALTSQQGLFSDEVHGILADDFGNFWMGCHQGVFRVRQRDLNEAADGKASAITKVTYGLQEGLLSTECNIVAQPSAWKSRDGRLWFATAKGLSVVDPQFNLKINEKPPGIFIEEVIADRQSIKMVNRDNDKSEDDQTHSPIQPFSDSTHQRFQHLAISPGRGELEFHYTALSFSAPEKNRFKYKLQGVDPDWVDAGSRRVAYYNNIKPGAYTFHVIGCNNDGVWNETGAKVTLTLRPHFWQTWWFQTLGVMAAVGMVGGTARFITKKRMQRWLGLLEQQHAIEKERTRIAQDMHDDLGVRLSEILLLSDLTRKKEAKLEEVQTTNGKISQAARDLVDNLDAIVWAVNPKNDSLDRFSDYLCENVPMYLKTGAIRCSFDVPIKMPSYPLSSEVRHNLFLVVKEALHNIIKHAQASEVGITLRIADETLFIGIADNGKGFTQKAGPASGNGLINMKERMERIGGRFELTNESGKGTRISLKIPIKKGAEHRT